MAPSLFQPHRVRQAVRDAHEKRIPLLIETMTTIVHETAFMSGGRAIPWLTLGFALDAGASNSRHVVSAERFGASRGDTRSVPPCRYVQDVTDIRIDIDKDIWHNLNEQAAIIIQIESLLGIDNLDDISTQVPDINMVWLGSIDARVSMGLPSRGQEPAWLKAVDRFQATVKKHNKPYASFAFGRTSELPKTTAGMSMALVTSDTEQLMPMRVHLGEAKAILALKGDTSV
ncbi:Phosphoenolpyruvate/pyruvate domain-containing protein [Trichoderma barbatum]